MLAGLLLCAVLIAVLVLTALSLPQPSGGRTGARARRRWRARGGDTGDLGRTPGEGEEGGRGLGSSSDLGSVRAVYLGYSDVGNIAQAVRAAADARYTLAILAFWMGPGVGADPYSAAWHWSQLGATERQATLTYAHDHGCKVLVSAGGAAYGAYPPSGAAAFGQGVATFAQTYGLDGIDFDFEQLTPAFGTPSGLNKTQTIAWLTTATTTAKTQLGVSSVITHAPQSPYFNVEFSYGYLDFAKQSPAPPVDFYLIQYYNQGATYKTYESQFINDDNYHPGTAVAQLISAGISPQQIVVGRLTQPADGDPQTWIDPAVLGQWFAQAATDSRTSNWKTGFSTWQWHASGSPTSAQFLAAVYPSGSSSFGTDRRARTDDRDYPSRFRK